MRQVWKKITISFLVMLTLVSSVPVTRVTATTDGVIQNLGEIYIDDFIDEILQPLIDRANLLPTHPNYYVNLETLRELLQQRPYVTHFTTFQTGTVMGAFESYEHFFQSHATLTSPHTVLVNAIGRPTTTIFTNIPNSINSLIARIRYRTLGSPQYLAMVGRHNSLQNSAIHFDGAVTQIMQYRVVFEEQGTGPSPWPDVVITPIQDMYLDDFIDNVILPVAERARMPTQMLGIDLFNLIPIPPVNPSDIIGNIFPNGHAQRPYVTQIITRINWDVAWSPQWEIYLPISPLTANNTYGHFFVSSPAPIELNDYMFERGTQSGLIDVEHTRQVARVEYLVGYSTIFQNVVNVPTYNSQGQSRGRIVEVRNFRVYQEEDGPDPVTVDYDPEVQTIYIDDFINDVIAPVTYEFLSLVPWPMPDNFDRMRDYIINDGLVYVERFRMLGIDHLTSTQRVEYTQDLFWMHNSATRTWDSDFWNVPDSMRESPYDRLHSRDGAWPQFWRANMIWSTGSQHSIHVISPDASFDIFGRYPYGTILFVERYHIVFDRDEPGPCPPADCGCPYPPLTEYHFHEHIENHFHEHHYHEHVENHFHEYIENHFHEHFITENHYHEHFITEYHTHETHNHEHFITEEHFHEHITNYITHIIENHYHFHSDEYGNWPDWPGGMDTYMLQLILEAIQEFHRDAVGSIEDQTVAIVDGLEDQTEAIIESVEYTRVSIIDTLHELFYQMLYFFDYWFEGFGVLIFLLFALANIAFVIWIVALIWKAIYIAVIQAWFWA